MAGRRDYALFALMPGTGPWVQRGAEAPLPRCACRCTMPGPPARQGQQDSAVRDLVGDLTAARPDTGSPIGRNGPSRCAPIQVSRQSLARLSSCTLDGEWKAMASLFDTPRWGIAAGITGAVLAVTVQDSTEAGSVERCARQPHQSIFRMAVQCRIHDKLGRRLALSARVHYRRFRSSSTAPRGHSPSVLGNQLGEVK